ncbi:hypothetical protein GALL_384050 [mine drainage metagenome]|uniref:Uncharacterized protein n=1 Tax=mine drainage metagenome TaxID=410659 RepID=A0A1J5QVC8_9ZZZZ
MRAVIETNVAIAANGRETHASYACQYSCIEFLEQIVSLKSKDIILLDSYDLILDEYKKYLNFKGQPGVGDIFFKYLHDNMYLNVKIKKINITPADDDTRGFQELPFNQLDKSDRKFLAVALVGLGIVVNAMDSDWHEQIVSINAMGVKVNQLCPEHGCPNPTA